MSADAKASDPLVNVIDEIVAQAQRDEFVVFYGFKEGPENATVVWNEERGGDWRKFLTAAKTLGARVVYLNWAPFEEFQVDEALIETSDEEGEDSNDPDVDEHNQEVGVYRDKVGLIAQIDLAFMADGVTHIYRRSPEWFETFLQLTQEADEGPDEDQPEPLADKKTIEKWARSLATEARFVGCKTQTQRLYLLEELAGDDYERLPGREVLRRAEMIFAFEVRPKVDEELRTKARALREQGLNLSAIAQKLGISRDRVSGLLAD